MNTLEQLLSQPLKTIVDNGFSLQVLEKINRYQAFRAKIFSMLTIVLSLIFISVFPVKDWFVNLFNSTQNFGSSFAQQVMPSEVINNGKILLNSSELFQQPSTIIPVCFILLSLVMLFNSYLTD